MDNCKVSQKTGCFLTAESKLTDGKLSGRKKHNRIKINNPQRQPWSFRDCQEKSFQELCGELNGKTPETTSHMKVSIKANWTSSTYQQNSY